MNQRNLLILFAALGLAALAAWLLSEDDSGSLSEGDPVLPGLAAVLNDINSVTVRRAGDTTVATLRRDEGGWVLADRDDYPANFARIRQNLRGLADAQIFEAKTANAEFYERLGVRDIADPEAAGTELDIQAPGYSARVIIGRTDEGGGSLAYVRRAGDAQSYLVTASLDPGSQSADWLDTAILDLPSARVRSVQIRHPDGEILAIAKPRSESTNYTVADVPEGRSLTYDGVANAIGAALAGLKLDDVEPAAGFDAGDAEPTVASFETFDGLVVEARTWQRDESTVHAFAATVTTPEPAEETPGEAEGDAGAEGSDDPIDAEAVARVQQEADTINARLNGWIYTTPSFKAEQFTRRMDDLLAAAE
ncbi:MAG: DUF4340 domain-containing protein [Chromatiales bacterium]|nr:MAG: DUF4340 domain-containing protein [Chromatiales bacterium]